MEFLLSISLFFFNIDLNLNSTMKINGAPEFVRLSEKLQHAVIKFDRSNKFDFCYYGQVNSLRLNGV